MTCSRTLLNGPDWQPDWTSAMQPMRPSAIRRPDGWEPVAAYPASPHRP